MTFHVGQKVVCVDDQDTHVDGIQELERGKIYTVRWVGQQEAYRTYDYRWQRAYLGVRLVEISPRGDCAVVWDTPFCVTRFRPVQERKRETSIECFKKLLNPQRIDA